MGLDIVIHTLFNNPSLPTVALPPSPLLNQLSAPAPERAYSTRLLSSTYSGPLVRVRRSSDGAEADFGAIYGELDTIGLLEFAGSGSAYIRTWFDQSGKNRHMVQTTAAAQARLVNAGTLDAIGGKPAAYFGGAAYYRENSTGLYAAGAATATAVVSGAAQAAAGTRIGVEFGTAGSSQYKLLGTATGDLHVQTPNGAGIHSLGTVFVSAPKQVMTVDTGAALTLSDGTRESAALAYARSGTFAPAGFAIGAHINSGTPEQWFIGQIAELIAWSTALDATNRAAVRTSEKAFYSTV